VKLSLIWKNPVIKIFCLGAAFALWVYVSASQNTIGKFPGSITIKAINVPSGHVAMFDIKTVDIKVMADPSVWSKLSADSFSAYIDAAGHAEGTYELPVTVVSSVPGVQVTEKTPDRIMVRLEGIVSKEVDIRAKTEGSAGEGLIAGNITLDPIKTTVKGPKSTLNSINEAVALIRLDGEVDKFERNIILVAYDVNGEAIGDIEFLPAEAKASVAIVKASNNKTVGVKVNVIGSPKAGFYISSITVTPSVVDIVGSPNVLSEINFIETLPVSVLDLEASFEKDIGLNLKNSVSLQAGVPSRFKVKIVIDRSDASQVVTGTVKYANLPFGYAVSSINPSEIKVTCIGPNDIIASLKSSDVIVTLDFNGVKPSNNSLIPISINSNNIKVPEGVLVSNVVPTVVMVSIGQVS